MKSSSGLVIPLLAAVLCLIPSTLGWSQGKGSGVEVLRTSAPLLSTSPGQLLSIGFRVTNRTDRRGEFLESLRLPEGWRTVIPLSPFTLEPSQSTTRILALQVPGQLTAGRYEVAYEVRERQDSSLRDGDTVGIQTLPVTKLSLLLEDAPEFVIAGSSFRVQVRAVNDGNIPEEVTLKAVSPDPRIKLEMEPSNITLPFSHIRLNNPAPVITIPPGDSRLLVLNGSIPTALKRSDTFNLSVSLMKAGDRAPAAVLVVPVQAVPRALGSGDLRHMVATRLKISGTGERRKSGVQAEWKGKGSLDEAGRRGVDFLLRGPDTRGASIFGERNEVRMNYAAPNFSLFSGDQTYGLSSLTQGFEYGRGLGFRYRPAKNTEVGLYQVSPRWSRISGRSTGMFVRQRLSDTAEVKINLLNNTVAENRPQGERPNKIWSVEADLKPDKNTGIHLEVGKNESRSASDEGAVAYQFDVNHRFGSGGSFTGRRTRAGSGFHGYYHDLDYTTASLSLPVNARLNAQVTGSSWKRSLSRRVESTSAPLEQLIQAQLQYNLPSQWRFALGMDQIRKQDRLSALDENTRRRLLRLSLGRATGKLSWSLDVAAGRETDLARGKSSPDQDYRAMVAYQPREGRFFSFYTGYNQNGELGEQSGGNNSMGTYVAWKFSRELEMRGWYTAYNISGNRPRSEMGDLEIKNGLDDGRSLSLRLFARKYGSENPLFTYYVSYEVPLGVPVSKKRSVGVVSGRITDLEQPGRPGIAAALLSLNDTAVVSGENGEFAFTDLPPGFYMLTVDRKSLGKGRITDKDLPMKVEVAGGKTSRVELGVFKAASVMGEVRLIPAVTALSAGPATGRVVGNPRVQETERGLGNILVEIRQGDIVHRTLTDSQGRYRFDSLRPGAWKLTVYENGLPDYHKIEEATLTLELKPEAATLHNFRVLPRQRKVIFVGEEAQIR